MKKPQKQCIEVVDCCERSVVYGFFEGCFDVKEIQEAIYGIKNTFENNEIEQKQERNPLPLSEA